MASVPEHILGFLKNWIITYVKHKNLLTKDIIEIKESEDSVYVLYKDKKQFFSLIPFMNSIEEIFEKMKKAKLEHNLTSFTIVCFNTKKNLNILIANWNKFIAFKELSFIFVNPFSKTEKKWIIFPYYHAKISESESLEQGLKSMYSLVDETTQEFIEKVLS